MTDPIGDMLSRIKNAQAIRADVVDMPHSKAKEAVLRVLSEAGFIGKVETLKRMEKKYLRVGLRYHPNKKGFVAGFKRVSKPGSRVYAACRALPRVQSGFGMAIVSTPKGIMKDEIARAQNLGGEVMLYVW